MKIGLSTYSFFWKIEHDLVENKGNPFELLKYMINETARLSVNNQTVFQICDFSYIHDFTDQQYASLKEFSNSLNVELELGIRGVASCDLLNSYNVCAKLGVKTLRTMLIPQDENEVIDESVYQINKCIEKFEKRNIFIVIENYELVPVQSILSVIKKVNSENLLICLDPANSVAALEMPKEVIKRLAPLTRNLHVKDFTFSREDGWVGFKYSGTNLGDGLLDIDYLLSEVLKSSYINSAVIELWVPMESTIEETVNKETKWREQSYHYLIEKLQKTKQKGIL